ncbi:MAG TPA: hypothetical protein VG269_25660, partial [Tepidisphaeraceae bacterium]|nr:hypothetical protein [Tepidisphaeraceae bacterium]
KGLHKVRYFGLWHPAKRKDAARARLLLLRDLPAAVPQAQTTADAAEPSVRRSCLPINEQPTTNKRVARRHEWARATG